MDKDRLRVLAFALVYVALLVLPSFFLDWFVWTTEGARISLDLRAANICIEGRCQLVAVGSTPGLGAYVYGAWLTFWGAMLLALLVAFQVLSRMLSGYAHPKLSRTGIIAAMVMIPFAAATGFVLGPEAEPMMGAAARFERSLAPLLLILANVAAIFALHLAAHESTDDDAGEYRPVVLSAPTPPQGSSGSAPPRLPSGALPLFPDHLRRLRFVVQSAELTRGGIDARRADGSSLLVMWPDVVGVIARRLPLELDCETFVDLVSAPGSTLRIMAWTRLTGSPLPGDGDARARAFVAFVATHCPSAKIDPATRAFFEREVPAPQLANVPELAVYDARLE